MSDPAISTTVATQALLVGLHFGLPPQSRQSKPEAKKVEDNNHAARGVTRVSIHYFSQIVGTETTDALFNLKQFQNAWRADHVRLTRPWDGGEMRLLPAKLIQTYMDMESKYVEQWPGVVAEFIAVYPDWALTAPSRMGALYNANDFPSLDLCREAITYECPKLPLPAAEQFKRITLISPNLAADMEASTNQRVARAVAEAKTQTFKDVLDPIQKIVDTRTKDKPKIFESLIGNLNDIISLVPAFNLDNDADLNRLATEAREQLTTVNAEDLRADPELRKTTAKNAQEILRRFATFGQRKFAV